MGRIFALVRKELRQHLVALIALAGLMVFGMAFLLVIFGLVAKQNISLLSAHVFFLWSFLVVGGVILGNRLVVAEYHARTQLFVESLPVRRWEMVTVKYCLGLAVLMAVALGSMGLGAAFSAISEPVDGRFLAIVGTRTAVFTFALWSFLFGMGFTGRFRIPLYLAIMLLLAFLGNTTELDLARVGPVAVAHLDTMPLERNVFPVRALLETAVLGGVFVGVAFGLGLLNEGSMAEVLARRMSQKEKSLVGLLFVGLLASITVLDQKREKEPLSFADYEEFLKSDSQPLEILYLAERNKADAEALQAGLEADLVGLRELLGWEEPPPLRVALRGALDPTTFERAQLSENDGVLLRANFRRGEHWDERAFRAYALRELLRERTHGRAEFEPRAWFLDGFSRWWTERDRHTPDVAKPLLRAAWATRDAPLTAEQVRAWFATREQLGREIAEGLAYAGVRALEAAGGEKAVLAVAKALYGREAPEDSRETLREWYESSEARVARESGVAFDALVGAWNRELDRLRATPEVAEQLGRIPVVSGAVTVQKDVGTIRHLECSLEFQAAPPVGTPCVLVHRLLSPYELQIYPYEVLRLEHAWRGSEREATFSLLGRYGPGSYVFVALEVESPVLGCPLRLVAERRVIQ